MTTTTDMDVYKAAFNLGYDVYCSNGDKDENPFEYWEERTWAEREEIAGWVGQTLEDEDAPEWVFGAFENWIDGWDEARVDLSRTEWDRD